MPERLHSPGPGRKEQRRQHGRERRRAHAPLGERGQRERGERTDGNQHRRQPRQLARVLIEDRELGRDARDNGERADDPRAAPALQQLRGARAGEHGDERREQRDVIGMEDAFRQLNTTPVTSRAPPTAINQPLRGSARRRRLATRMPIPLTSAKPSSQPA